MMHKKSETVVEGAPADFLLSEDSEDCKKKNTILIPVPRPGPYLKYAYDKKLRVANKCFIVH